MMVPITKTTSEDAADAFLPTEAGVLEAVDPVIMAPVVVLAIIPIIRDTPVATTWSTATALPLNVGPVFENP